MFNFLLLSSLGPISLVLWPPVLPFTMFLLSPYSLAFTSLSSWRMLERANRFPVRFTRYFFVLHLPGTGREAPRAEKACLSHSPGTGPCTQEVLTTYF